MLTMRGWGDFFPGVSGWMVAFFLTLALSIGAIPLLVIQWRRMDVGMHIPGWASDCQCFTRLFYCALRIHLIPVKQFVSLNHN
ncbi:hypothetical protein EOD39_16387 [Acipenser ruthenus]|uniref:Uncharacterized protein n=1 Tax=Acipenser ruthenus TaxID=7906 RepID=A0A444V648_ACIRT|nr:hypothetical protein EOD39_16387 [Acipenser ruthenus]